MLVNVPGRVQGGLMGGGDEEPRNGSIWPSSRLASSSKRIITENALDRLHSADGQRRKYAHT